jgi:hypothetical protein
MGERGRDLHGELHIENEGEEQAENELTPETTFGFPILDLVQDVNMKNIPLSALPTFHGKSSEDPDVFLFEFDILRKSKTEPAVTQEPAGPSRINKEAPTVINKAVQTLPIEEITPPSQGTPSTTREQSTQTLPDPTTANAQTQTSHRWDEYAEIQRWKKEYAEIQAQKLQVHRQTWRNHTFLNWEALDLTRQETRKVKKNNRELKR